MSCQKQPCSPALVSCGLEPDSGSSQDEMQIGTKVQKLKLGIGLLQPCVRGSLEPRRVLQKDHGLRLGA